MGTHKGSWGRDAWPTPALLGRLLHCMRHQMKTGPAIAIVGGPTDPHRSTKSTTVDDLILETLQDHPGSDMFPVEELESFWALQGMW